MKELGYLDFKVDEILSTFKNPNKKNICRINQKYFFQIPNQHEESLTDDQEQDYYEEIDVKEEGRYAKVTQLQDLFKMCKYFQVDDSITYALIFQMLKFVPMSETFIVYQQKMQSKVLDLIQEHGIQYVFNSIDALISYNKNRVEYIKQTIHYEFCKHFLIHPSLSQAIFKPNNLQKIENLILNNRGDEIIKKEQDKLMDYIYLLEYDILNICPIFDQEYDLKEEKVWSVQEVQNLLDNSIFYQKLSKVRLNHYKFQKSELLQNDQNKKKTLSDKKIHQHAQQLARNKNESTDYFSKNTLEHLKFIYRNGVYSSQMLTSNIFPIIPRAVDQMYSNENKVIIEMRQLNNTEYTFATRNQNLSQVHYLFQPKYGEMYLNRYLKQSIQKIMSREQNFFSCLYLQIENFNLNIDYDVVEHVFDLPDLANYLRERKIFYFDPNTKEEKPLEVKKGIFYGESFQHFIASRMSFFIKELIEIKLLQDFRKELKMSYFKVYNYNNQFIIQIHHFTNQIFPSAKIVAILQLFVFSITYLLKQIGMVVDKKKTHLLNIEQGIEKVWRMNKDGKFKECNQFLVQGKDWLDIRRDEKLILAPIKNFVYKFAFDICNNNVNFDLVLGRLLQLQKCYYARFFYLYFKKMGFSKLQLLLQEIIRYLRQDLSLMSDSFWAAFDDLHKTNRYLI